MFPAFRICSIIFSDLLCCVYQLPQTHTFWFCGPVRGPIRGPVDIQFAIFLNNLIAKNRCKQLKIRKLRQKNGRGERNPALSFANSLFQQIYPLKYAFYLWATLWSSYCYCDLPNIVHIEKNTSDTLYMFQSFHKSYII